uniref:TonB-dependent transporter Oar-like beta-barrel domain-containing protein n=1 Tax=Solibacter usitatus (strain Ellin6076) TaxID=234267 RepID=Q01ZH1_SOLUE
MTIRPSLLVFFAAAALCLAQSERGTITGLVTDASNAAVPNAPIKLVNVGTNASTEVMASSSGEYSVANLGPGAYRLEITKPGFQSAIVDNIILTAGATARVDVRLQVGGVTQTVEVQSQNALVQTEDAKVSTAVSNKLVDELPLVVGGAMRSPFDLVTTVPEAKNGTNLALGGGQGGAFAATFDGVSVNTNRQGNTTETSYLTPSVEAITEFAVDTSGFKAEYGQAGGGIISFASKSGTNEVHGSAYDFIRNDYVDSRGFFAPTKGIYRQNDFGGSLGAPIYLPKIYNGRNRTFFFVAYEGFRNRQGSAGVISSVPTPEMYNGDFTNLVNSKNQQIPIYDPSTTRANPNGAGSIRDPFPGNIIPVQKFSSVSNQYLAIAKTVLLPNRAGIVPGTIGYISNNYVSSGGSSAESTTKVSVKVDHAITSKHHVSYLFNRGSDLLQPGSSGPAGLPIPFNGFSQSSFDADLHRVTYDWTVSPRMFNHFSLGINTFNKDAFSTNVGKNWKNKVCIINAVDCNVNFGNVSFSEFSGWGGAADNGTEQPRRAFKDDLSYVRGAHSFKFGGTYDHQEANGFGQQNIAGQAGFSFLETAVPGATSATSGSSFASFLLGYGDTGATETIRYLRQVYRYWGFYAQDDFRVSRKLMINYGLRYEFTLPPISGGDQYSDFSPTTPNPAVNNYPGALIFAGDGPGRQGVRSLIPGYYGSISPRLGFAYSPNSKTTIRGGIGRSFGRVTVLASSSHYAGFIGQYNFASTNQGITPAFTWDKGLPPYPLPPQINPAFANNGNVDWWNGQNSTRPAEYDNWTLSVQRELPAHFTVEADYNAAIGSRLNAGLMNINQVPMSVMNSLIARFGVTQAISLMNSSITSPAAVAAGFTPPYANFTDPTVQRSQTVSQSLRAFPQYLTIDAAAGGGDRTGHSTYHAGILKLNRRMANSLTFQGSYGFSKILTNADSFSGSSGSLDAGNRALERSVGAFDQTHTVKLSTVYELPFGRGKRWLAKGGVTNAVLGGWRLSGIQTYNSGFPIGVTSNGTLPIFNGTNRPLVTTYDWRAPISGSSFDPNKDKYLDPTVFPVQPVGILGNSPRKNSTVRVFPNKNENVSLAKTFSVTERFRIDFRAEAFNVFNRVVFGGPQTSLNSSTFGVISSQANSPRQMQGGLKLYW